MLKAWGTVLDPSRFGICCHSPLVSSKRLRALTVVIMDPSFYKVVAFISFITLGWCLRKFNVLKPEAFQAISGLVMFVTLPCTTITGLNGTTIGGEMALIALLGFLANIAFLIVAFLWTMRAADKDERDFRRLNTCGLSIGPFAVPYVQAFLPTSGLVTTLMADVGNAVMAAGGYAIIESMRSKTSWLSMAKRICYNLLHSGPIVAFLLYGGALPLGDQTARSGHHRHWVPRRCQHVPLHDHDRRIDQFVGDIQGSSLHSEDPRRASGDSARARTLFLVLPALGLRRSPGLGAGGLCAGSGYEPDLHRSP
ncbi:MAG: AEC family transporter [Sutterella wadsworthensis]